MTGPAASGAGRFASFPNRLAASSRSQTRQSDRAIVAKPTQLRSTSRGSSRRRAWYAHCFSSYSSMSEPETSSDLLDVAVVGGGVCGVSIARVLYERGLNVALFEARPRLGGRVVSVACTEHAALDLGPTWYWPASQPRMQALATGRASRLRAASATCASMCRTRRILDTVLPSFRAPTGVAVCSSQAPSRPSARAVTGGRAGSGRARAGAAVAGGEVTAVQGGLP
jgi:hypothetical protein